MNTNTKHSCADPGNFPSNNSPTSHPYQRRQLTSAYSNSIHCSLHAQLPESRYLHVILNGNSRLMEQVGQQSLRCDFGVSHRIPVCIIFQYLRYLSTLCWKDSFFRVRILITKSPSAVNNCKRALTLVQPHVQHSRYQVGECPPYTKQKNPFRSECFSGPGFLADQTAAQTR